MLIPHILLRKKITLNLGEPDPILESIIVYVDQEVVYEWSYIEKSNIIQLRFIPDYGSIVEVGYKVYN